MPDPYKPPNPGNTNAPWMNKILNPQSNPSMPGQPGDPNDVYNQIYNSIIGQGKEGGGQWGQTDTTAMIKQFQDAFTNNFNNVVGRPPTPAELNQYLTSVVAPIAGTPGGFSAANNFGAANQLAQSYIPTAFGKDIKSYNQQQIDDQTKKLQGEQLDYYTKGSGMDTLKKSLNDAGMLDSGAFSSALAQDVSNISAGGGGVFGNFTLPATGGNMNPGYGSQYGTSQGNFGSMNQDVQKYLDYLLQGDQASSMFGNQPSGFDRYGPGIAQGVAQGAAQHTSAICLELMRRGLVTQGEFDELHWKIVPAMFKRCRALYFYAHNGHKLVEAANKRGLNWQAVKHWFIDEPLSHHDPLKVVHQYSLACRNLAYLVAPELWDDRVLESSVWDFLKFIVPVLMVKDYRRCYGELIKRRFFNPIFNEVV